MSERDSMPYDIVIVGGGPAGLSSAIRLKQLANEAGQELSVCVLEKGSEIGAHILSGAVVDPKALDELFPEWRDMGCPMAEVPVTDNQHWFLSKGGKMSMPHIMTPGWMHNKGTYTGSLGNLCRWLAEQAEGLGVEIFPGFAAAEILYNEDGSVKGVATGDMGIDREGNRKPDYQPGLELHARYTFFAEGARGHLTKILKRQFALDADSEPQVYGLGMKELWDIDPAKHKPGLVIHTQGWPLTDAYGGGFLYHQANGQVALGFVVGLGYRNPYLYPFEEFQRWKQHPEIRKYLEGGRRVSYGARAINEGGWQSIPKLAFPGGALIGCSAGFVNVPRIKGTHTAMKSGMLAAEAAFAAIRAERSSDVLDDYEANLRSSWIATELQLVKNAEPLLSKFGNTIGTVLAGIDMWMRTLKIGLPFTMKHKPDAEKLWRKDVSRKIDYPKPDGVISFDRLSSVFLSNTNHEEDQPVHLQLKDPSIPISYNLPLYDEPAQRYCPAGVYEVVGLEEGEPRFQINAQNCVHCKTCDIKDPTQNINWVVPEGGGGPNYPNM
ncbi:MULTISPECIES: electron transfer flavoprotein-ubiquinone oxidoreductase [Sphingobium]|uniref:Electron transfer flavoprotein-ubiquinone oxidoreductase n=1 Tax=Sphingobium fuliginis (strain ATCC 27551) TaxID=336203 RepID=A0ABQ1EWE0_SPHSA|nr:MULTISPECIES: electron transfer flavoprotein-ubiquinone oxidoreductase [Sphingobium]AJR25539.1 electron transfer flavoprotein-ubiquinone oxidoreductase [Sphingobium sp. YBL2]MCB4859700.1 electron transfer flavoprotein-ubiquinone oxidoreductase [Sphingobium sp. PNB]PNQ01335.1 electron transfer flavoprotein-ubiquinone oxidoreductase [Sphingobium sp. SA916]RYL98836.1 electron transfer flavoprotein-ubiquinone oxidoreductase [Sphingobium fuliginis]UXC92066.1 electron transfer flavoprotein-ubiqui